MNEQQRAAMQMALRKAFNLGQTYWRQADSEYASHWNKADATKAKFEELVEETDAALREALAQPQGEWVDLTDDEIAKLKTNALHQPMSLSEFAHAVIAAFKEKNK